MMTKGDIIWVYNCCMIERLHIEASRNDESSLVACSNPIFKSWYDRQNSSLSLIALWDWLLAQTFYEELTKLWTELMMWLLELDYPAHIHPKNTPEEGVICYFPRPLLISVTVPPQSPPKAAVSLQTLRQSHYTSFLSSSSCSSSAMSFYLFLPPLLFPIFIFIPTVSPSPCCYQRSLDLARPAASCRGPAASCRGPAASCRGPAAASVTMYSSRDLLLRTVEAAAITAP